MTDIEAVLEGQDWQAICNRQEIARQNDPAALAVIARVRGRRLHFYDAVALGWW